MAKGRIETGWETYRQKVVPANASAIQVIETKKAFYAGASYLLSRTLVDLGPGTEPSEDDMAMMDGIHAELVAFLQSLVE